MLTFIRGVMLTAGLIGLAGIGVYLVLPPSLANDEFYPVWIPDNAQVREANSVHPGTFKITISFEELRETTKPDQQILMVYNELSDNRASVSYWRSEGNSIFSYATTQFPSRFHWESWGLIPVYRTISFSREQGGFAYTNPQKDPSFLFFMMVPSGGILALWLMVWSGSTRPQR